MRSINGKEFNEIYTRVAQHVCTLNILMPTLHILINVVMCYKFAFALFFSSSCYRFLSLSLFRAHCFALHVYFWLIRSISSSLFLIFTRFHKIPQHTINPYNQDQQQLNGKQIQFLQIKKHTSHRRNQTTHIRIHTCKLTSKWNFYSTFWWHIFTCVKCSAYRNRWTPLYGCPVRYHMAYRIFQTLVSGHSINIYILWLT